MFKNDMPPECPFRRMKKADFARAQVGDVVYDVVTYLQRGVVETGIVIFMEKHSYMKVKFASRISLCHRDQVGVKR